LDNGVGVGLGVVEYEVPGMWNCDTLGEADGMFDVLGELVTVAVLDGLAVMVALAVLETLAVLEGLAVGEADRDAVAEGEGVTDDVGEGDTDGVIAETIGASRAKECRDGTMESRRFEDICLDNVSRVIAAWP